MGRATWRRPEPLEVALVALLGATAVLYLWDLDRSGFANNYYSAAAQAGASSWKAFLFGGLDAGGFSTVDKPPLFLWPMALMVRCFGLSSTSILLPQALEGIAIVWLLHDCVRRATGSRVPALLAAACLAVTPVATLMFRFNNPDSLMTLLLVGSGWYTLRALQSGRHPMGWLAGGGALVGLAFLTKMFEGVLVTPGMVAAYVVYGHRGLRSRVGHLVVALGAAVASSGWWVVLVELWPPARRPWVGGLTTDSVIQLAVGYNGLARITGTGSTTLGGRGLAATNLARIARTDIAPEVIWFVPAALVLGLGGAWLAMRSRDTLLRASFTMWGGWLLSAGATFVVMAGIFHAYYTVLLAPALAALAGTGAWLLWQRRHDAIGGRRTRRLLAAAASLTVVTGTVILAVAGGPFRWVSVPVALLACAPLVRRSLWSDRSRVWTMAVASLAAPFVFSIATAATTHTGSGPEAGPANGVSTHLFGRWASTPETSSADVADPDLAGLLRVAPPTTRWVAAVPGARAAAAYELATGRPVLAIGGYKGTDPTPGLAQFEQLVASGQVRYLLVDGTSGPASTAILAWAATVSPEQHLGTAGYYDLTARPMPAPTNTGATA